MNHLDTKATNSRTALVTGGGSGIGRSICTRLAGDGARVLVLDLGLEAAQETADRIGKSGGDALAYACDVADRGQVADVVRAIEFQNEIDILINNAGIAHIGNVENTTEADMDRLYSVNVKGIYNMLSAVVPAMKERRGGVIVNMASIGAWVGLADRFAYSMSKGAVVAMTLSTAKDYIEYGIRCNCVSPGRVHTPFVDNFLDANYSDTRDDMFEKLSKSQPIGRMGTAKEVAGLVAYLCSDEAEFITGSNFPIDGGFVTLNT